MLRGADSYAARLRVSLCAELTGHDKDNTLWLTSLFLISHEQNRLISTTVRVRMHVCVTLFWIPFHALNSPSLLPPTKQTEIRWTVIPECKEQCAVKRVQQSSAQPKSGVSNSNTKFVDQISKKMFRVEGWTGSILLKSDWNDHIAYIEPGTQPTNYSL